MNFKDKLRIALSFCRKQNKIIYSLIMILCSLTALTILTVNTNYKKMQKTITSSSDYRTMFVYPPEGDKYLTEEVKQKILAMDHIVDVYDFYEWITVDTNINGEQKELVLKRLISDDLPYITSGKKYKDNQSNAIVCPEIFYFFDSFDSAENIDKSKAYNLKEILNKEIDISYYDYKPLPGEDPILPFILKEGKNELHYEKLKIVGLFKNGSVLNETDVCYINTTDFERIRDNQHSEFYKAQYEVDDGISSSAFRVVVDKIENIDKVTDDLAKNGMERTSPKIELDQEIYKIYLAVSLSVFVISIFTIIMITLSYVKKKILREEKNMTLMITEGFTKKEIGQIYALSMAIQNTILYIISLLIFFILFVLIINKVQFLIYFDMLVGIKMSMLNCIILFAIIVILPSTFFYLKTKTKLKYN